MFQLSYLIQSQPQIVSQSHMGSSHNERTRHKHMDLEANQPLKKRNKSYTKQSSRKIAEKIQNTIPYW
jgi:hypothetical protein